MVLDVIYSQMPFRVLEAIPDMIGMVEVDDACNLLTTLDTVITPRQQFLMQARAKFIFVDAGLNLEDFKEFQEKITAIIFNT